MFVGCLINLIIIFVIVTLAAQRRGFPFWVESEPIREVLESDESDVGATTIPAYRTHFC